MTCPHPTFDGMPVLQRLGERHPRCLLCELPIPDVRATDEPTLGHGEPLGYVAAVAWGEREPVYRNLGRG